MFTPQSAVRLAQIADGEPVTIQGVNYESLFRLPYAMGDDCEALRAVGVYPNDCGTNASCERWILNVVLSAEVRRILTASAVTYKHIEAGKKWW